MSEKLICTFCNKECKNKNSLAQHECRCKSNPNRLIIIGNKYSHPAWNKGLTKDTDPRIAAYGKSFTENHNLGLHKDQSGANNPSARPEVRSKISATCLEKSKNGEWHKSIAKNMHYNYKGIDLDGTWELKYAMWLDEHNIKWLRPSNRFEYILDGQIHFYTPDFYLIDSDEYIEIKGFKTAKDEAKWKAFPKNKKLKILFSKDLKDIGIID